MSVDKDLKALDDLNDTLDKVVEFAENSLSTIGDFEDDAQDKIQQEVDKICEKVSDKATKKLNQVRDKTVEDLHKKYLSANKIVSDLQPIVDAKLSDLGSVISVLTKLIALYAKPCKQALDYTVGFVGVATPKLADSAEKVAKLYNLKDEIPIPEGLDINFDKLKITMNPISIDDIIKGA